MRTFLVTAGLGQWDRYEAETHEAAARQAAERYPRAAKLYVYELSGRLGRVGEQASVIRVGLFAVVLFVTVVCAVAAGVYLGEWLWWHHVAQVAHDQLCRSFPSPTCR